MKLKAAAAVIVLLKRRADDRSPNMGTSSSSVVAAAGSEAHAGEVRGIAHGGEGGAAAEGHCTAELLVEDVEHAAQAVLPSDRQGEKHGLAEKHCRRAER